MSPLEIAVIGAGLIGRRHAEAISNSNGAAVAGIVDPSDEARQFARDRSFDWFSDLAKMLASRRPDGAIIATPNQLHLPLGLEALREKLPVLIEKPLADSVQSAQQLVDQSDAMGTPLLVGHHRRHNPIIMAAKEKIDGGLLGDIVAVNGMCWLYKPADYFETKWRTKKGAGPVYINLIHDVDLLRHLIGEIVTVEALEATDTRGHDVEDTAAIILRFANGALGTLSVSDTVVAPWSWELTAAENLAYPATEQNCYFIGGTRGSLELPASKVWAQAGERSWWEPIDENAIEFVHQDPIDVQIDHFCDVIRGQAPPRVSGLDGLRSLQVISAIKQSAHQKTAVELPLLEH
ncbi:MAG: Gfo/Idh/MocA family oxidoreductase [Alphaproteobacteria bacterium]|nr:Gfo/Idh/MocA family oxidoreductase [Alphaproteobacteria bacterium]